MTENAPVTSSVEETPSKANTIAGLKAAFDRLSAAERQRNAIGFPPTGDASIDTLVFVAPGNACEEFEGVVVNGTRLPDGQWDFDCNFTLFTTEHELFRFIGHGCEVTIL